MSYCGDAGGIKLVVSNDRERENDDKDKTNNTITKDKHNRKIIILINEGTKDKYIYKEKYI